MPESVLEVCNLCVFVTDCVLKQIVVYRQYTYVFIILLYVFIYSSSYQSIILLLYFMYYTERLIKQTLRVLNNKRAE